MTDRRNADPLMMSGIALADRIRSGELSAVGVLDAHVRRIEAVNPELNAIVAERFGEARKEAEAADAAVRDGQTAAQRPFHGVPCSIKESFALTGMPQTAGLVSRVGTICESDATTVRRWREAGAIPVGVTNISELCMWWETNNRVYGRTNNPYDARRIVGGSSGGEGAIVGAGAVPFGLGADIGGSIRLPAFFNGVFGHKPTGGRVPGSGQFPAAEGAGLRYLTTGPLARRSEDLWPLLTVLAGPDGEDGGCVEMPLGDPAAVRVDQLRVISVPDNGFRRVSRDMREAQERACVALAQAGARVERHRIPALRASFALWSTLLGDAQREHSFRALLEAGSPKSMTVEVLRWTAGRSPHTLPAIVLAAVERLSEVVSGSAEKAHAATAALRAEIDDLLGDDAVLLIPPCTRTAPRHYHPLLTPLDFAYTAIFNVLELPVTQVPLGLDHRGLPLGTQVVAGHAHDHLSIAVAGTLESALGGWTPPPSMMQRR